MQEFKEVIAFYDGAVDLDVRVQVARLSKKFIGFGGFANVFLVTRKSDGVLVAMKQS